MRSSPAWTSARRACASRSSTAQRAGSARPPPSIRCMRKTDDPDFATQSPRRPHGGAGRGDAAGARATRACDGDARSRRSRSTPPARPSFRWTRDSCRSTTTTSGAIIARRSEAARNHRVARREELRGASQWCGGVYSSEWGFAKLLHWLRHNPEKRAASSPRSSTATWSAAVLCGITDPDEAFRAASAPWATSGCGTPNSADLPPEEFLQTSTRCCAGVREKLAGATPPRTKSPGG